MPDAKTNRLSVYLIKREVQDVRDIIDCEEQPLTVPGIGEFYFERSRPHPPTWLSNFFNDQLDGSLNILAASARGLFLVPVQDGNELKRFAVSFGVGRYLLKEGVFEERFGLKVVLNSVDPASFRSITKTTLSSIPKHSREQMSKTVTPAEFGLDIEQDLVSSVTGVSRDPTLGKTITGGDALNVSVKVDVSTVQGFLVHCLGRYKSDDYKRDFEWIDQIAEVRGVRKRQDLDELLVQKLNGGDLSKIWMAVPEEVNWSDVAGFYYGGRRRSVPHDDLDVPTFLRSLNGVAVTIDLLKNQNVVMVSASSDGVSGRWSAFRCMYAEIPLNNELFILTNGKWYGINTDFVAQVLNDYQNTGTSSLLLPDCDVNDEGSYNSMAAQTIPGSCCMDQKMIFHGGGHSQIEFCDVFTNDKRMVHIKKYAGSSVLSHLFSQGAVSGELFFRDTEFRQKLNDELPQSHKLLDPTTKPTASDYEIVFGIISNSQNTLDVPFFSKVALRNAKKRLKDGFGYTVTLKKIQKTSASSNDV